jgi:predicted alpha/beta superfamily hydrolase
MQQQVIHHTTSTNVHILDTAFYIPQLKRYRRLWIYLPHNYHDTKKKFPVLYMHDGQNIFDAATAYAGEWGIDEHLDLIKANYIVVAIDNGGLKRMQEYNVNDNKQFGNREGKQYLQFIVTTLKPFIDGKYRTFKNTANTSILGSSMGGLISFYAGMYYPKVFGNIGVFSPSFWIVPGIEQQVTENFNKKIHGKQQWYFYAGGKEGVSMVPQMQSIHNLLFKHAGIKSTAVVDDEAMHNERAWQKAFPAFYNWLKK